MLVWPKLLPGLRPINTTLPVANFATMKAIPALKPSRAVPIFPRMFPYRLKYQSLTSRIQSTLGQQQQVRAFSTMRKFSTRGRTVSGPGSEIRATKSLIDDEADLSDWVSGLNSKSFNKTQLHSDSSDNDNGRDNSRVSRDRGDNGRDNGRFSRDRGDNGRDNGRFSRDRGDNGRDKSRFSRDRGDNGRDNSRFSRDRGDNGRDNSRFSRDRGDTRGNERRESDGKRRRGSDIDDFKVSNRKSGPRESTESFPRRKGEFSGEWGGEKRWNRENGSNKEGTMFGRGNRENGRNEFSRQKTKESNERLSRGLRDRQNGSKMFRQNGRDSKDRFLRGRDSDERASRFLGDRRKNEGRQEPLMDSRMEFGRNNKQKGVGRGELMLSDEQDEEDDEDEEEEEEEEKEKGYVRFKELIDSGESSEEVDNDVTDDEVVDDAFEKGSLFSQAGNEGTLSQSGSPSSFPEGSDSYLSETRFDQCSISHSSMKALKDVGYEKMTVVQEATLPLILRGKDVLAKAKTGTGKTVAFLLPSIEVIVNSPPATRDERRPPILVLVVCPTRELASQAATEANTLLKYHPSFGVQVVIGGTRLALEQKRMQSNPCQILVATPGRLRDHIENTAGFATRLMGVKVLVLDEADHLLDMGFRKDIEKIIAAVPKQRQTLLFSATIPEEVRHICHIALKRDHEFVNTVQEGSEETHSQVRQMHIVAPLEKQFTLLYTLLKEHIANDVDYKVLVFCTTAMVTRLVADLLGELNLNIREIHSRKPQSYRTRISDEFRKSKGLILVTSDVSARGVDYPDVTLVVQIGLPADRQQYIHRLGRTGRKGKEGQGMLILAPWEEFFLSTIKDLPTTKAEMPIVDPDAKRKVERALSQVEMKNKEAAYQAWLGYYNSNKTVGRDKYRLVELANEFSRCMGLDNPPTIAKLVLGKMGLKNIPGLRSK